mmetsp:Transcript_41285/g.39759  ORF Transcript_41285/g.39759 Transcript_41285/m.39759 type:complete len:104 (+) Transcript_41285:346-657(+)
MQLVVTFYFAYLTFLLSQVRVWLGPALCINYPLMIGAFKQILLKVEAPFKMEEVFEFSSLAFGAFPYRFLYLELDQWSQFIIIICVKYLYKFFFYFFGLKYRK